MSRNPSYYPAPPTSSLALASLIAGILGWVALPLLSSLVAVITGHMAKREIQAAGGDLGGDGMATAGLVLGYVQLIPSLLCICTLTVMALTGMAVPILDEILNF